MSETVVMLHGFGGTARQWDRVVALIDRDRYSPVALELGDATPLSLAGAVELVARAQSGPFVLCGYSMGGRVALHVALAMPALVSRLVLVSTSAGIEQAEARSARLAADELLAVETEDGSVEDFIVRWRRTALFAEDPAWVQEVVAEDTRRLTPQLLAATLRAYSAGLLEPLWGRLGSLEMPVAVLAGERDTRYRELGQRLAGELARGSYALVRGAGHRIAIEAPAAVAGALDQHRSESGPARGALHSC